MKLRTRGRSLFGLRTQKSVHAANPRVYAFVHLSAAPQSASSMIKLNWIFELVIYAHKAFFGRKKIQRALMWFGHARQHLFIVWPGCCSFVCVHVQIKCIVRIHGGAFSLVDVAPRVLCVWSASRPCTRACIMYFAYNGNTFVALSPKARAVCRTLALGCQIAARVSKHGLI